MLRPNHFQVFLICLTISLIYSPISFCQKCTEPIQCGGLGLGYPFYGDARPEYCGFRGFELKCVNDVPLITIQSLTYRVLAVDTSTEALTIAREDLWSNLCPSSLYNTTLDFNIFNYGTDVQNITLYYGCSISPGKVFEPPNQFNCIPNNTTIFSFYVEMDEPLATFDDVIRCNTFISVPVNLKASLALSNLTSSASNLKLALGSGFDVRWFANNTSCNECSGTSGQCGYNSSSSSFVCHCTNGQYPRSCGEASSSVHAKIPLSIIITLASVLFSAVLIFYAIYRYRGRCFLLSRKQRPNTRNDQNVEDFMRNWGSFAPKQYSYAEIKKITKSLKEKLGQGGYGSVYKGKLPDGRFVAVKILNETEGNGEDFINEVSSISRTSHVNVVTLLGFCYIKRRALIYEFMPNGSLDKFIYKNVMLNDECHLEWKTLYEITIGIARGLEYLHRGLSTRIVHFDIKPHNILLDEGFCPKISDFGLAKLSEKKESILSAFTARGTPGYIAPEVIFRHLGGVSHKSDIYSYGMMILEMVGVRKNVAEVVRSSEVYFPQWIYEHLELGTEINIQAVTCEEEEEISRKMILVGLWCIQTNPSDRPAISKVVEMLEGSLHSLRIPPKPFLYSPKQSPESERSFLDSSTSIS